MGKYVEPNGSSAEERRATPVRRIAVLGAGRVGTALGRALVDAGYSVSLSGAGDPAQVMMIASIVAPGTEAMWAKDAVKEADLVILAIPMHRISALDPALLSGRTVVDAMNYWPPVDGTIEEFEVTEGGTSSVVQQMFPDATIVKTFNHVGYHDLEPDRRPTQDPDRLGLAVAGDNPTAVAEVAQIVDAVGYDPVTLPTLVAGRFLQPGGDLFGARLTAAEIVHATPRTPVAQPTGATTQDASGPTGINSLGIPSLSQPLQGSARE